MKESDESSNYKIHSTYAIVILSAIIVGLVSVKWSEVPRLYEYINFALTMSSLILAILAIVYALHSSGTLFKTLDKIEGSAESIKTISSDISESNNELRKEVERIPSAITSVDKKLDDSQQLIRRLSEESFFTPSSGDKEKHDISEGLVKRYIEKSPLLGCDALLVVIIMYKEEVVADLDQLLSKVGNDFSSRYMFAYIISAESMGLISFEHIEMTGRIKLTFVNNALMENVERIHSEKYQALSKSLKESGRQDRYEKVKNRHVEIIEAVKEEKHLC
ncbi:hypothetical protein QLQ85_16670 [Halomonas sp. M4R5S39]|uniref:hypothetical protein n=1 Tax=Halomonas kalidii TaxID=3043293 RepID=UPI0024A94259|nr:hypothetical protein [Halomonas kalidii]MDI5986428.1 hypothetical protein [Halomonas kalidii]